MIRDFHADPLPQGCPFSFISVLKKNTVTKESKEAILGALRYKTCEVPDNPADQLAREIKDWFAFSLDEKTCGLWGYFNEGKCNFKVTAGGKKEANGSVTGKDQSLVELWDGEKYHGMNLYVKQESSKPEAGYYLYSAGFADAYTSVIKEGESSFWGFSASKYEYKLQASNTQTLWELWSSQGFYHGTYAKSNEVGSYQSCNGNAEFYGTLVKTSEASMWGYNSSNWQFKMESKGSATSLQMWNAGATTVGFAKMYAYSSAGGFSCSLGDKVSSTLEPSSLWCIDNSNPSNKQNSNLYAGGLWIGQNNNTHSCFIDGATIWVKMPGGADAKMYPGWVGLKNDQGHYWYINGSTTQFSDGGTPATLYPGGLYLDEGGGKVDIQCSHIGNDYAYFQQVDICVGGQKKTAYFLMTTPK